MESSRLLQTAWRYVANFMPVKSRNSIETMVPPKTFAQHHHQKPATEMDSHTLQCHSRSNAPTARGAKQSAADW